MKLDLDCKEVSRLISFGLDANLPPGERARLRLHFVICATCRNVDESSGVVHNCMKDPAFSRTARYSGR